MFAIAPAARRDCAGLRLQKRQCEAEAQQHEQETGRNAAHK
jgi:hypothetical protein